MPLVQQFMTRPDATIDMLKELLAMREKEEVRQADREFSARYSRCQARVTKAEKDKPNPVFRSRYASLEAMYDAVWPAVMEEGFGWTVSALMQAPPGWEDNRVMWFQGRLTLGIITRTCELPVSRDALTPEGPRGGRAAMTPTQALGALTTYMRKYLLGLMFGVVTKEDLEVDNDGNRAPPPKPSPPPRPNGGDRWIDKLMQKVAEADTPGAKASVLRTALSSTWDDPEELERFDSDRTWRNFTGTLPSEHAFALHNLVEVRVTELRNAEDNNTPFDAGGAA